MKCNIANLNVKSGANFEYVISQLSVGTKVLCVADGYELLIFDSVRDIPLNLHLVGGYIIRNDEIGTTEYHWRSDTNKSLYAFFDIEVHRVLLERETEYIRSKPIIIGSHSDSNRELTKKYVRIL